MKIISAFIFASVKSDEEELDRETKQYYRNQGRVLLYNKIFYCHKLSKKGVKLSKGYSPYNQQYYPGRNIPQYPINNYNQFR